MMSIVTVLVFGRQYSPTLSLSRSSFLSRLLPLSYYICILAVDYILISLFPRLISSGSYGEIYVTDLYQKRYEAKDVFIYIKLQYIILTSAAFITIAK